MLRIKEIRVEKGITQTELAESLGIARNTLSQYETGKRSPDYSTLSNMADFLHVTVDDLLGRTDSPLTPEEEQRIIAEFRESQKDPSKQNALIFKYGGGTEKLVLSDEQLAFIKDMVKNNNSTEDWGTAKAILDALRESKKGK